MPAWLLWGILISGGSAVYWWKKANPGKSLNPTEPFASSDVKPRQSSKP